MRSTLFLPLLLLGACGKAPDSPQATGQAPSPAAVPAPAPQPALLASPAHLDNNAAAMGEAATLPVALQGRWTDQKDDCADPPSDMELTIAPRELLFHESAGTVTSVEPLPHGGARVAAHFTGEGESWNRTLALTLSADGRLLTVVGDGMSVARKRCPR